MLKFLDKIFDPSQKAIKGVQPIVNQINKLGEEYKNKSEEELQSIVDEVRKEVRQLADEIPQKYKTSLKAPDQTPEYVSKEERLKDTLLSHMPKVYAAIREVTHRNMGIRHYDVQLVASSILAQGYKLTELKTGEGKTLVFQLPAALYGLTGRGAHVITVNDYLAKRDGEYAGHVLSRLGFSVGIITSEQAYKFVTNSEVKNYKGEEIGEQAEKQDVKNPGDCEGLNLIDVTKREAYSCDVVYGTNNEFGFDYLRDNMVTEIERISQRELYFCIVDEADSVLIDEARTPLIISAPAEQSNELYMRFAQLVPKLKEEKDYTVDEKAHTVILTDEGAERMEKLLGVQNIWQDYALAHHLENALKAMRLYHRDKEYIVKDGQIYIVDDFTGRVLEGRRYSEGLHQAIEAKEGVEIKRESKTMATITFQNFFRLYKILSGGSGTVLTEAEEFYKIYNLESIAVPTHKPVIRQDLTDRVYKHQEAKFNAVVEDVIQIHSAGQPVLIGTASIEDSETVSRKLEQAGIEHEVLNAKHHERESKIVANAGKKGAVTVATNMAGRGTDIKLGGKRATDNEFEEIVKLGGLYIVGTQRHDSRRIDNQLRGRSGRQGEPGVSRFYVALDDDIMRIQGGEMVQRVMSMTNLPDNMPLETRLIGRSIENAQKRMEGMHFDSRKTVVEYDDVVNQQREILYSRRRRLLEEIEAIKKESEGRENTDKDDLVSNESYKALVDDLKIRLMNEVDFIVGNHFMTERSDKVDVENVIKDFLDLGNDQFINKILGDKFPDKAGENAVKSLTNLLEGKEQDEIRDLLRQVAEDLFTTKIQEFGDDLPNVSKFLVLRTIDQLWTDHLDAMKALRDGIGLRGFAQQDPLVEYKNEGFSMFDKMIAEIDSQIARRVLKVQKVLAPTQRNEEPQDLKTNEEEVKEVSTGTRELESMINRNLSQRRNSPIRTAPQKTVVKTVTVGRNDPCPCGSGLKYKKCGMINAPQHKG